MVEIGDGVMAGLRHAVEVAAPPKAEKEPPNSVSVGLSHRLARIGRV